jgi:hypothetical protein
MHRRELIKDAARLSLGAYASKVLHSASSSSSVEEVEQWGVFEAQFRGPSRGNPFVDVQLTAEFVQANRRVEVSGFYDGDGVYRIRYMPDVRGSWRYTTRSNVPELNGRAGSFRAVAPREGNHGPVKVAHEFHFAHVDGTPYFPFGTTCYSLGFLGEPFEQQTLDALRGAGFNKVRLCLLPKSLGRLQPVGMPFERTARSPTRDDELLRDGGTSRQRFDTTRLDPTYFRHFERVIEKLNALGVQADVILFHPYDAWGFSRMPAASDDLYLRYAIARLAAYRNVWWSVANEYDLVRGKSLADWDRFFRIITAADPSGHLRSIHHSRVVYDHSKSWITHASVQQFDFENAASLRKAWGKPIIYDEIQYEGNIARRWGNLSAEEMTRRFWLAIAHGAYATHGETFITPPDEPVWSDGGRLRGSSAPRIRYLHELLMRITRVGLTEFEGAYYPSAGKEGELYLYYFDYHSPGEYDFPLPAGVRFRATIIDPFGMSARRLPGSLTGRARGRAANPDEGAGDTAAGDTNHLRLPGKPYMAVLLERE